MGFGDKKNAYYLKWALGRKKCILPQMGFGSRSWEPKLGAEAPSRAQGAKEKSKGNFSLKLGAEAGSRNAVQSNLRQIVTPLKNPLGPQLRVLAVWGINQIN